MEAEDQSKSFSRASLGQRRGGEGGRERKKESQLLMLNGSDTFSKSLGDGKVVVVEANGDYGRCRHSEGPLGQRPNLTHTSSLEAGNAFWLS